MTFSLERPLVLVGAGKMGSALLSSWLAKGLSPDLVCVRDPAAPDAIKALAAKGLSLNASVQDIAVRDPGLVLVAVKPQAMASVLPELAPMVRPETVFLSIAAGTGLHRLKELLGPEVHAIRAMPNTPASIGRGITVACANDRVTREQRELADTLLAAAGEVGWVDSEALIDAVTAISGSGPAYVFYLVECLAAAGEALGLDADLAMKLARETVSGSGEMLHRLEEPASVLRANVTSPGGTTAAALDVLMGEGGLSPLMRRAALAARDRARELGK
ncbi:pyrroline-5-carboxylate reductase [Parvibaculum sp.]|uniref:pyrroline-5-carboxylate reductase n=1 Tax=Parvibaculum sp. TaxID=2024848 RepID=UPI001B2BDF94|nr:pyrroline-5-carboxylate reductase [Parvibaculum sp.]MBO6633116.1 pyrroline-5-carboxylate reductase [Parvibaculum sp.]MBO6679648.1 pyrroline-5-carboxylate reductase [Parvibaculum sp.]MBO6686186.1 pyrroline-5-carboxylate reductase [Parvibaculum sp.]